jgi:uncharacterized protein YPO0396
LQEFDPVGRDEQFRLCRLQTFNWGTFDGVTDVRIPASGYLFVGPSGSGKSTLLDAHAAVLTPPKWVDFNVAAREAERTGKDRNLLSYVRGAWSNQTGETGEHGVQYLRQGSTWTAISETYQNRQGRTVVLAQVLWVRGNSAGNADVKKLYLVLQRPFELKELEFFAKHDFDVRRFKQELPDALVKDEFSAYQERFRALLGIESERALRLLHKTQSAKNLGDLNVFLRDFMLDPPETFQVADRLVEEFTELNAAHQAVLAAKRQIETLSPARAHFNELQRCKAERSLLEQLSSRVDAYRDRQRAHLLTERIQELETAVDGADQELARLVAATADEQLALTTIRGQRDGAGSAIVHLTDQVRVARDDLATRKNKHAQAAAACTALGWELAGTAEGFAQLVASAKDRLGHSGDASRTAEQRTDLLKSRQRELVKEFGDVRTEIEAMESQRSNIPAFFLTMRADLARGVGMPEIELPFAGELMEVAKEAAAWQGAIERVLHSFALSLLVSDAHYSRVSSFLDSYATRGRLVYLRTIPRDGARTNVGLNSLVQKVVIPNGAHATYLRQELAERFNYECAETVTAFRAAQKAVTRAGQIKHNHSRHEKDDRVDISDRRGWLLGTDNRAKLQLFKERAGELGAELAQVDGQIEQAAMERERHYKQLLHCQTLANLLWAEVDVVSLENKIARLEEQIEAEKKARPELAQLEAHVTAQEQRWQEAIKSQNAMQLRRDRLEGELNSRNKEFEALGRAPAPPFDETQLNALEARFSATGSELTLESLEAVTLAVVRQLNIELKELTEQIAESRNEIEKSFVEFNRQWPAESGGLDPRLASAEDYLAKLTRLETDGLPRFVDRFLQLLREQSDQNLTLLRTRLDIERTAIRDRLQLVNESLLTAPFNPGTHLVIESMDRALEEVRQFKQSLTSALARSFNPDKEREAAEQRFAVLSELVKRLGSQETIDKNWRNLILDVRQHVEFIAREIDQNEQEVEVYRSGAGKSGGQRQKLAATCLAAALRYQLGGQDRALPSFSTVVLDEAFDKADAEFTRMAMNIFTTFGFQMIVATPLKSVMALEPFIGGACFVHIKDRKHSAMLVIEYDEQAKRLKLPEKARDGEEAAVS